MTKTVSHEDLAEILETIEVESASSFRLGGRRFTVSTATHDPSQPPRGHRPPVDQPAPLVTSLTHALYRYVYSHSWTGVVPEESGDPADVAAMRRGKEFQPDDALLARLSAANTTCERWEHGWTIGRIHSDGRIQARRGQLRRQVWPGQFLSKDGPGARPRIGSEISLFYAKESVALQPAFYYLFGETPEEQAHDYGIMRLYWNVSPEGAPALLGAVSRLLNRFRVPFRMKCAVALADYERTDVAVLYLPKCMARFVCGLLPELWSEVCDHLADAVPFFSRRLAPGLGLAEDPGNGESFGQHRCRLMAEAVWTCFLRGEQRTSARLAELEQLFSKNGVHPQNPHLNIDSLDWYDFAEVTHDRAA